MGQEGNKNVPDKLFRMFIGSMLDHSPLVSLVCQYPLTILKDNYFCWWLPNKAIFPQFDIELLINIFLENLLASIFTLEDVENYLEN